MSLIACKSCGKVFDSETSKRDFCIDCLRRLENIYSKIHEFIKNSSEKNFEIDYLSEAVDVDPKDIQKLIELGYIERDIQTYGRDLSDRQKLALEFEQAIEKLNEKIRITTYGGKIYKRK